MRQRPQFFDGRPDVVRKPIHQCPGSFGVSLRELLEETNLHGKRNEVLLRAVVQVALNASSLGVIGRYQPPPDFPHAI